MFHERGAWIFKEESHMHTYGSTQKSRSDLMQMEIQIEGKGIMYRERKI